MSRHRDIRNLNIDEELEDDALSDGGGEPMTQEEEDELYDALEGVRAVIGSAQASGISDKELKDCLWHEYYDVQKAVDWALGEQERRRAAQERKVENDDSALEYWRSRNSGNNEDLSRVPKIILAQQQAQQQQAEQQDPCGQPYLTIEDDDSTESPVLWAPRTELSTITERTELVTEPSPAWTSHNLPVPTRRGRAGADSSRTTSYGEELADDSQTQRFFAHIMEQETPRQRPISLQQQSSTLDSSAVPSIRMSSATTIPADSPTKEAPPPDKPLPDRPLSVVSKKSKLASLASSRSRLSVAASSLPGSSRDDGTSVSGSVKTFPALRPSPHSDLASSSTPLSRASEGLPSNSASSFISHDADSQSTGELEMEAEVQKAIQAALQLEDLNPSSERPKLTLAQPQSPAPSKGISLRSLQSARSAISQQSPKVVASQPQRSASEIKAPSPATPKVASSPPMPKPQSPAPSSVQSSPASPRDSMVSGKPKSKLALLAQQKVSANKAPKLPAPKTEYLVPTANGATATTAITTSYQSLFSLTDPKRPAFTPKLDMVPISTGQVVSKTQATKTSKLAMKVKKASEKTVVETAAEEPQEANTTSLSPIFQDASHPRASPSAFASVLVRDDLMLFQSPRKSKESLGRQSRNEGPERRKSRVSKSEAIASSLTPPTAFAFDSPSPDDIVFQARRGTALAQSKVKSARSATTSTLSSCS